jgi:excisionase family DNA binding protein
MEDGYITIKEACERAHRNQQTIYRWLREGDLTRYKVGPGRGFTRISVKELDGLLTPVVAVPVVPTRSAS